MTNFCHDAHSGGSGSLLGTLGASTASVSMEVSILTASELPFTIALSHAFLPGGVKTGGTNKSVSCTKTSDCLLKTSQSPFLPLGSALTFRPAVQGIGGGTTSTKDALSSDDSSSYSLEAIFCFS